MTKDEELRVGASIDRMEAVMLRNDRLVYAMLEDKRIGEPANVA